MFMYSILLYCQWTDHPFKLLCHLSEQDMEKLYGYSSPWLELGCSIENNLMC